MLFNGARLNELECTICEELSWTPNYAVLVIQPMISPTSLL